MVIDSKLIKTNCSTFEKFAELFKYFQIFQYVIIRNYFNSRIKVMLSNESHITKIKNLSLFSNHFRLRNLRE